MIVIKNISIAELPAFLDSQEYKAMPEIPISRHRGISHYNNRCAKPEDKILFLAYEETKFVGYLGAMPDELTFNKKTIQVAWLSCMWVDTSQRGKGIAPMLLSHAHKTWNGNLLITNFIPLAKRAYDKTGLFTEFKSLPGVRGYLRFNLTEILISKKPDFQKIKWLLKTIDGGLNIVNEIRLLRWRLKLNVKNISFEFVRDIDSDILKLIETQNYTHLAPKNVRYFHWLMQFPWILEGPFEDENSKRYAFSSVRKDFSQYYVKILDADKIPVAFVILTKRDGQLKTPYLYFNERYTEIVYKFILALALKKGIKTITTYNPLISKRALTSWNPFILTRKLNYRILISKDLKEKLGNTGDYILIEGDGDAAFV